MRRGNRPAALLALFLAAALAGADLYSPNRPLRVIRTEWFDIQFPADARAQAERLASFADDAYREIAVLLGTEPRLRYPVTLTPDPDAPNGWYSVWPRRRIVLFLAPTDPNERLGYQSDDLRALFRHELAHAVSLTIRPAFWAALAAVFGDAAGLSYFTTPSNLVEGLSIAVESPDGWGRAADPLTAGDVRQDAREGRFKSFWESAGAWDRYPYGRVPYSYGALFTRYLLEEYGAESYRELWRRMGRGLVLPGLGDFLFIRGVFRQVYGISLSEAWEGFQAWASPSVPAGMPRILTPPGYVTALAASEGTVWRAEGAARRILALDARTGRPGGSWPGDLSITRLAVSDDGNRLLVSHSVDEGGIPRLALRELDLAGGRSRLLPYRGLRDGAWAGDGIVAVRAEAGGTSLVIVRDGREELLASGSASVSWASPCASPDGRWIYALCRSEGEVFIARLPATPAVPGEAAAAAPRLERLVLPAGFRSLRWLSLDGEGTLRFSWHDGQVYRPAELRGNLVRYPTAPLSGGAHQAVSSGGTLFFLGYFSEGAVLCSLPSGTEWADLHAAWAPLAGETKGLEATVPAVPLDSRPYSILPWLVPGLRYPALRLSSEGLWALGAGIAGGDPAETLEYRVGALWVPYLEAVDLFASIEIQALAPSLVLVFRDEFEAEPGGAARTTRAGLSLTQKRFPVRRPRAFGGDGGGGNLVHVPRARRGSVRAQGRGGGGGNPDRFLRPLGLRHKETRRPPGRRSRTCALRGRRASARSAGKPRGTRSLGAPARLTPGPCPGPARCGRPLARTFLRCGRPILRGFLGRGLLSGLCRALGRGDRALVRLRGRLRLARRPRDPGQAGACASPAPGSFRGRPRRPGGRGAGRFGLCPAYPGVRPPARAIRPPPAQRLDGGGIRAVSRPYPVPLPT